MPTKTSEEITPWLPEGVIVRIKNRFGWLAVLPLDVKPAEFSVMGFYLDFANNLVMQHEIMKRKVMYSAPYKICRPAPDNEWHVIWMVP